MCLIVSPTPWPQSGVGPVPPTTSSEQFLHFPVVPVCQFPSLPQASCVCVCVHACMGVCEHHASCYLGSGTFSPTPGVETAPLLHRSSWTDWKYCCRLPNTATLPSFTSRFGGELWAVNAEVDPSVWLKLEMRKLSAVKMKSCVICWRIKAYLMLLALTQQMRSSVVGTCGISVYGADLTLISPRLCTCMRVSVRTV